jgi:hypothetical protein
MRPKLISVTLDADEWSAIRAAAEIAKTMQSTARPPHTPRAWDSLGRAIALLDRAYAFELGCRLRRMRGHI